VQSPLAHARPLSPHDCPLGCVLSAGQVADVPVHVSTMSHALSLEGRQTCVEGANWHVPVQHGPESGSHNALGSSLHVVVSQHVELTPTPGSQSSPGSTIPLPHICRENVFCPGSGALMHVMSILLPLISEQIFPIVQAEKTCSLLDETGDMRKREPELQVCAVSGQQSSERLQPSAQSCWRTRSVIGKDSGHGIGKELTMAPKLWPISCATTCHSVRPLVLTAVPLTTLGALPVDFWLHTVPNHATPTSVPDGQPDMRCQRPLWSTAPFKLSNFCPRQAEKSERRSLSDTVPHATFHGLAVSLAGQL